MIGREGKVGIKLGPVLVAAPISSPVKARRVGGQNLLGISYIAPDFDAPMSEEELKDWGY